MRTNQDDDGGNAGHEQHPTGTELDLKVGNTPGHVNVGEGGPGEKHGEDELPLQEKGADEGSVQPCLGPTKTAA